jgi:hypothetical protein
VNLGFGRTGSDCLCSEQVRVRAARLFVWIDVGAASFPVRMDECTGATLAAGGRCQVFVRLDTSLAGAAEANPRVTEGSSDARLHGFVIGGYTGDGDAEPGSRCKSDTVLATVTRELEPPVATDVHSSTRRQPRLPRRST